MRDITNYILKILYKSYQGGFSHNTAELMGFCFLINLNTERMNFLEKDLEQIIWESDNEKLQEKNLFIYGKKYRQLRIANYGVLDILTVEKDYYFCPYDKKNIPFSKYNCF